MFSIFNKRSVKMLLKLNLLILVYFLVLQRLIDIKKCLT